MDKATYQQQDLPHNSHTITKNNIYALYRRARGSAINYNKGLSKLSDCKIEWLVKVEGQADRNAEQ